MKDTEGNLVVVKANKLIQQFKFSLSAAEMQVVNFIIANINSPLYDESFNTLEFEISDFYKAMGIENPGGSSYEYIKRVIQGLRNKTSDYINFGEYETIVSWIEKPKFFPKKGKVLLKLDDDLKPYLLKANGVMMAQLKYYFKMESKYSMRLYDLLKSWDGYKTLRYEFERLRLSIDAIKKSYEKWNAFETYVLAPAVKEINDITDMTVSYEKETQGRGGKVTHIVFSYDYKPGMRPKKKDVIDVEAHEVKDNDGVQEEFTDTDSFNEYVSEMQSYENNKFDKDDEFVRTHYSILVEQFPEFNAKQIIALFEAAFKHLGPEYIGAKMDEKQYAIVSYIRPKLRKINATPEETKSTTFSRLLNMVENDY